MRAKMFEKQYQDVGDGSLAVQVKRDLIINQGLQLAEVRELCLLFLQQNFPKLREEAIDAARKNVESYIPVLEAAIAKQAEKIDPRKIADPDMQASINDSVQATARKGQKANFAMLAELVSTRMRSDTSPILSVVAEEAIRLVPRLTASQIAYLALCFFLNRLQFGAKTIEEFEIIAAQVMPIVKFGLEISDSNLQHTAYVGATSVMNMVGSAYYGVLSGRYPFLAGELILHDAIANRAPTFHILCEQYRISKVYNVTLTSVGELVAILTISDAFPVALDPSRWIN
jgi:hypothetical protein